MVRIDDRLIHGQVVAGWCPLVTPDHLILCDDEIAQSEWESELYKDAASEYKTSVCSIKETVELINSEVAKNERIFLVVESPKTIVKLMQQGVTLDRVIIGGMHYRPQKRCIAPFIYVDDEDIKHFKTLASRNIRLEGRDVPNCKVIDIDDILALTEDC